MSRSANPEEEAWREIVEHYGERAELGPEDLADIERDAAASDLREAATHDVVPQEQPDEHYVPPPAPPAPMPRGPRGLAWLGLFGAPTVALVLIVAKVAIPTLLGVTLLAAFVGGFGYLVATMRKDAPEDGWDDGAVL